MLPTIFANHMIEIYSYPLFVGLAWGFGYQISRDTLAKNSIETRGFLGLFLGVFISSWIGAKVLYLITVPGPQPTDFFHESSFWLGGGLVFFGGLIFGIIYTLIYCILLKKYKLSNLAFCLPALCVGHAVGRIGCFLAGCCYGKVCELPWSVMLHGGHRHPVQLYESVALFFLGAFLYIMIRRKSGYVSIILTYLVSYSAIRFLLEYLRGDKIRGILVLNVSTSGWISIFISIIVLSIIIWILFGKGPHHNEDKNLYKNG